MFAISLGNFPERDRRAEGQSKDWSPWNWNPIQGGGVGSWAKVNEFKTIDGGKTIYAETIPKLWDMPNEEAAARMRTWITFEPEMPNVVEVRCELICQRDPGDAWGPAALRPQEIPACYFTRNFSTIKTYLGGGSLHARRTDCHGETGARLHLPLPLLAGYGRGSEHQ